MNILFNHPPGIIVNLPGNTSKKINNLSADEKTFNKYKDLYNNALAKSGFKHKNSFQQEKDISTVTNNIKKKEKEDYMV